MFNAYCLLPLMRSLSDIGDTADVVITTTKLNTHKNNKKTKTENTFVLLHNTNNYLVKLQAGRLDGSRQSARRTDKETDRCVIAYRIVPLYRRRRVFHTEQWR